MGQDEYNLCCTEDCIVYEETNFVLISKSGLSTNGLFINKDSS